MKEDKYGESSTQLIEVWQKKKTEKLEKKMIPTK